MIMGSSSDRDGGFAALFKRLGDSAGLVLTVGIHGPEGKEPAENPDGKPAGPLTVADIATIHEYGLGHNPERSFIRAWADENKAQNEQALIKIGQAVVQGKFTAEQGLDRAGVRFVAEIQARIKAHIPPPLQLKTIERKKSSTPLIDKGQLWSSIRHKVTKDDEGGE